MVEEKDFKKEFEEFARKIKEENNPIFKDEDLEFDDLDNMLNLRNDLNSKRFLNSNNDFDFSNLDESSNLVDEFKNNDLSDLNNFDSNINLNLNNLNNLDSNNLKELKELFADESVNLDDFNSFFNDLSRYPTIDLENEDIKMNLVLKKDYSNFDLLNRKKEFIKDLKEFIDEFDKTDESDELMMLYED